MKLCESWVKRLKLMIFSLISMSWPFLKTWFYGSLILRITWLVISSHRTCLFIKGKRSCMMWKISFGMSHIYIGVVPMGLFGVVCRKSRCWVFWRHATPHLSVGIILLSGQPIKSYNVATIGQPFTKMFISFPRHVIGAKEMKVFLDGKNSL